MDTLNMKNRRSCLLTRAQPDQLVGLFNMPACHRMQGEVSQFPNPRFGSLVGGEKPVHITQFEPRDARMKSGNSSGWSAR